MHGNLTEVAIDDHCDTGGITALEKCGLLSKWDSDP